MEMPLKKCNLSVIVNLLPAWSYIYMKMLLIYGPPLVESSPCALWLYCNNCMCRQSFVTRLYIACSESQSVSQILSILNWTLYLALSQWAVASDQIWKFESIWHSVNVSIQQHKCTMIQHNKTVLSSNQTVLGDQGHHSKLFHSIQDNPIKYNCMPCWSLVYLIQENNIETISTSSSQVCTWE